MVISDVGDEEGVVGEETAAGKRVERVGKGWRGDEMREDEVVGDERILQVSGGLGNGKAQKTENSRWGYTTRAGFFRWTVDLRQTLGTVTRG